MCCPDAMISPVIQQGCTNYFDEVIVTMNINVHRQELTPDLNWWLLDDDEDVSAKLN